jgi:UDP-GlcNAc:undecaprenyl-phosphate/decaprenyl-phosphate GlcNAc-1-phosphate transferase
LFFGDAGTYAIAAMFGCAAIVWHSHGVAGDRLTSLQVCSLFLVLVLDMLRLIILRTRAGRSPMAADHNHLHHRLDDHFGWPAGLVVYLALVALPIVMAFQDFESAGALGVVLGIGSYLAVILYTRSALEGVPSETEVAPSLPEA